LSAQVEGEDHSVRGAVDQPFREQVLDAVLEPVDLEHPIQALDRVGQRFASLERCAGQFGRHDA